MRFWSYLFMAALVALVVAGMVVPSLTSAQEAKEAPAKQEAPAAKYVGAGACKPCHMGEAKGKIYETWLESAHAKSFEKLGAENQKNDACLGCHVTGKGKAMAAGKTAADLQGVQCEACHGAGSEYKSLTVMKDKAASAAKGLITPNEKVCAGCHTGTIPKECWAGAAAAPKFVFAEAVKKIEHHVPKK
jgi:hypothetical protein